MEWILIVYIAGTYNNHYETTRYSSKQDCERVERFINRSSPKTGFASKAYETECIKLEGKK